ncbi:MAG TPA: S9 family peptidase [Thermoanaerobaculia bacterium]|jgi:dipeptidyl-peptidase-4|nr:S9 family peptidase [Thermoanaerobaculia bacterium]
MKRALAIAILAATPLLAQKKPLTFESIYDPVGKVYFNGAVQNDFEWLDDTTFLWPRKNAKGEFAEWRLYDTATGKERALFDRAKLQRALVASGLPDDIAKKAADSDELQFDAKKTAVVFSANEDLYLYSIAKGTVTRLTSAPGEEEEATFSPNGQSIAFVRANDLHVVDLGGRERRLTTDGSVEVLNGKLDYVYQEEVYGRGIWKGFWWSPDSLRIAFLQLDEKPVPEFTVVDHIPYRLDLNVYDYPKAGDPNPRAKLFVVPASGGGRVEIDTARTGGEILIVNVAWKNGNTVVYQLQNREQNWLDLVSASPTDGTAKLLLHETTKAWVDVLGPAVWLADGSFLWQSERSGYRHVYHCNADGTVKAQITNGEWEVRELHGSDGQHVYFSGTERSPIGLDVYRVKLDGSGLTRISGPAGKHGAVFNPAMTQYVDRWSDVLTPDQIRVHRNDGTAVRTVEENRVAALAEYDLPKPEFVQVKTRDGFVMEATLIRPLNFDASKKYPVYQFTYAGPGAQQVRNEWRGQFMLFNQLVAQQGAIVFICDNRSASGKGAVSRWPVYKNFGELELRDLEDSVAWLKSQPYVDGSRIVLNGWSYGGFMVLYAMTHSKSWSAGIAGGPVADWRDYDSIYTERYMLMPQNNPEGYRKSSPRFELKNLHGNLLLLHGTTDDNVHVQNTVQTAWELQQMGTPFEMMLFPRTRHSVTQKNTLAFMQKTVLGFVKRQLQMLP